MSIVCNRLSIAFALSFSYHVYVSVYGHVRTRLTCTSDASIFPLTRPNSEPCLSRSKAPATPALTPCQSGRPVNPSALESRNGGSKHPFWDVYQSKPKPNSKALWGVCPGSEVTIETVQQWTIACRNCCVCVSNHSTILCFLFTPSVCTSHDHPPQSLLLSDCLSVYKCLCYKPFSRMWAMVAYLYLVAWATQL